MVWTQDVQVVSCLSDQRCITPEHYVAPILHANETVSLEEEDIPESELGAIPISSAQRTIGAVDREDMKLLGIGGILTRTKNGVTTHSDRSGR